MSGFDWNQLLEPPLGAILTGGLVTIVLLAVCGYFWLRSRETRLKERMVERGFSAEEIERVIRATSRHPLPPGRDPALRAHAA